MVACKDLDDACLSPNNASKYNLKEVTAVAINRRFVHFQCPLDGRLCTNYHVIEFPEYTSLYRSSTPTAVGQAIIDTKVVISCLDKALQRGAWNELFQFISQDKHRGLRIIVTPTTVVDDEDDLNIRVDCASVLSMADNPHLNVKTTAAGRRSVEKRRAKAAQSASVGLVVTGHMFRYLSSLNQSDPYEVK